MIMDGKIAGLHSSLDQFKNGMGDRIERHGESITEIKAHQGIMGKIMWVVGSTALAALVAAMVRLVVK